MRGAAVVIAVVVATGCGAPKRLDLDVVPGFSSNCAVLRFDAKYYELWTRGFSGEMKNIRSSLHIETSQPAPDLALHKGYRSVPAGAQLEITSVETGWGYENGHRLTIRGKVPVERAPMAQLTVHTFVFERFSIDAPNAQSFVEQAFRPCK